MKDSCPTPKGQLILKTLAMPSDTNVNGDIFGGWILSQMDIGGSILAKEITGLRTVTVAVNGMQFIQPVKIGDIVNCYGSLQKIGNTSLTLDMEVWVQPVLPNSPECPSVKVTEAIFTYVAIDENKKKISIPKNKIPKALTKTDWDE